MKPIVVVLLDGLGDRAHPELGGKTANEAAETPELDAFCARGSSGLLWPLGPGRAPSSETSALACMLGYARRRVPRPRRLRSPAAGRGRSVDNDAVYAFAALRPAVERDGALWLTGRPSRGGATASCERHGRRRSRAASSTDFHVLAEPPAVRGEAILRIDGGASPDVSRYGPVLSRPRPGDASLARAPRAADARPGCHRGMDDTGCYETLRDHTLSNAAESAARVSTRFSVITLKWWGQAQIAAWRFRRAAWARRERLHRGRRPFSGGSRKPGGGL